MKNTSQFIKTLLVIISFGFASYAQDFAKVDNIVADYPKSFSAPDKLAERINADFKRDDEKARAIFTWIAKNVKYDLAAYGVAERPVAYSFRTQEEKEARQRKFKEDLADKTLKTKKGVCQGYSTLFAVVAEKTGLEAEIIPGTSKSHPTHIGKLPTASDHAWNAVKIDGEWKLLDVTWAAGTVTGERPVFKFKFNDKYFFSNPDVFFLNHYPDDKKWLLTNKSEQEFAQLPLYYGNYLAGDYQFISPGIGVLPNSKPVMVPFRIKNLKPGDKVAYAFSNNNMFKEVQPVRNGDVAEFEIALDNSARGYLTVYINQRSVAAYKISRG